MKRIYPLLIALTFVAFWGCASQKPAVVVQPKVEAPPPAPMLGKAMEEAPAHLEGKQPPRIWKLAGIKFDTGSATIQPESYPILVKAATRLLRHPKLLIKVVGHTDSTGDKNMNYKLSLERAESVQKFLIANGVQPVRISAFGLGPDYPIGDNNTEIGRAENRRIELITAKAGERINKYRW